MRPYLVLLALKLVGCPYRWGGSNPWTGFDCSGLVVWLYQAFGLLPSGDWTAQTLFDHFTRNNPEAIRNMAPGDLDFFGTSTRRISHVMLRISHTLILGASGGDHTTTTAEIAQRQGAMVKVKQLDYRADHVASVHVLMPGD